MILWSIVFVIGCTTNYRKNTPSADVSATLFNVKRGTTIKYVNGIPVETHYSGDAGASVEGGLVAPDGSRVSMARTVGRGWKRNQTFSNPAEWCIPS